MAIWTEEARATEIARLFALIEHSDTQMAVVDYGLDWRRRGVTSRFGTRGRSHCEIYGLTVVKINDTWLAATEVEEY